MAEPKTDAATAPTVPQAHQVVVQGVPLSSLPVGPPNTSDETEPGGLFVVGGRVVNAHGEPHPSKSLDKDGNIVDRPAPAAAANPKDAEIERLKAELAAAKAESEAAAKTKAPAK